MSAVPAIIKTRNTQRKRKMHSVHKVSAEAQKLGETLIKHQYQNECPCEPKIGRIYKKNRSGYAQYDITYIYLHNVMPVSVKS